MIFQDLLVSDYFRMFNNETVYKKFGSKTAVNVNNGVVYDIRPDLPVVQVDYWEIFKV